uniref:Partial AB-hydrolase lipase domain-containing protein n=1 Tax=Strigamia maritima TaxID=126957 RepID=T1JB70_STRMM
MPLKVKELRNRDDEMARIDTNPEVALSPLKETDQFKPTLTEQNRDGWNLNARVEYSKSNQFQVQAQEELFHLRDGRAIPIDPEAYMTIEEIIKYHGYPLQVYDVITNDGYILTVHRIPYGKAGPGTKPRKPVMVQHEENVWLPYKELFNVVYTAVFKKDIDILPEFEAILRKHKPDFVALLKNPAKNAESREILRKGSGEGIPVLGRNVPQVIPQTMITEALIISDMFNLNEISAVELLLAGENQKANFVGVTRGLVAVLLYYDGRQSLVASLRALIQAREGRTWTLGLSNEMVNLSTKYTNQLLEEGLFRKILDLLLEMDLAKEIDKLQKNRGLGSPRHRKQVVDLIIETKQTLAECIYCLACQSALSSEHTLQLLAFLARHNPIAADGTMDNVSLALVMAVLYAVDVSVLEQTEDSELLLQKIPIISDPDFIPTIHKELSDANQWEQPQMKAVFQFAWAVSLRILSQQPNMQGFQQYFEEDEFILDQAVNNGVFNFLHTVLLANETFHLEEFYVKRFHSLITDFIIHMPLKVKELRNHGDEMARIILAHEQEGLDPPENLQRHFEELMQSISALYAKDPLKLELISEYWCPVEMSPGFSTTYPFRLPQKQVNLFKFVRLAGDLLPPSLYVPYIQMLSTLSKAQMCAHHCFNLLKLNGTGGHCSTVGWGHFFMSFHRYYANLRQELPLISDTQHIYRQRPPMRGITPLELKGLSSVLQLIQTIAEEDEFARIAMCENQQWLPLVVLLGLVGCSVPTTFKAELLLTLSAFAKTPTIAINLWHSLEVAQILQTVKTTSAYQSSGIQTELDEIEARNEEFPMTRAFLQLLCVLVDVTIPQTLGVGFRAPGFDPYLEFVRDSIFLKANTRAYKNSGEKWAVMAGCLTMFYKLLKNHEVLPEDFINQVAELQGGGSTTANKRPGHNILVYMLHDSAMLKMVLYIITEAVQVLAQYTNFPGKEDLQKSSLLALKLISTVLEKQSKFLDLLREFGSSLLVSSIDKLLLMINPRSGRADYIVCIAKFTTYGSFLPEHVYHVTKIFRHLCQSPVVQPQLVTLFTMNESETLELLNGFVETLDSDETESFDQKFDGTDASEVHSPQVTRLNIVQLMLNCLSQQQPNLTHFLLGFDLRKPINKTVLQEAGVLNSPRTCLHVILSQLALKGNSRQEPSCIRDAPMLAEAYYHLLHDLAADKDTSGPILRHLRTTHDFLYRQLQCLPFKLKSSDASKRSNPYTLLQQSWLLKLAAIEIHVTSLNRQRSQVQRLVNLLIDTNPEVALSNETGVEGDGPTLDIGMSSLSQLRPSNIVTAGIVRRKLLSILDAIDFTEHYPDPPQWEYFDPPSAELAISQCEKRQMNGLTVVNVLMLHQLLNRELNDLKGASALGQRPLISQEIQNILSYVVKRNKVRENVHAKRQIFDSWRQITEIILTAYPSEVLEGEKRQTVLFELIQELIHKVLNQSSVSELSHLVSGIILTLLANLRQCFIASETDMGKENLSGFNVLSETTLVSSTRLFRSSSLQVVLKGLLECILKSGGGPQRVRANYYAALLNFLRIAKKPKPFPALYNDKEVHELLDHRVTLDQEMEHEKLSRENVEIILGYGEHFMEVVCRDCCTSHDVNRMLTLACVDVIVSTDRNEHWLNYLVSKGYLRHLIESLLQDNQQLQNLILSANEPLRALYIYESKMALLTRLALSGSGAYALLENGIMSTLVECKVFDMRPEHEIHHASVLPMFNPNASAEGDGFLMMSIGRYRQILFPALRLCLAITTSLGHNNINASSQLLRFIVAHVEVFCTILRERHVKLTLPILQELSLVARVVARAAAVEYSDDLDQTITIEIQSHVKRLQRFMIALLQRYALTDSIKLSVISDGVSGFIQNEMQIRLLEVLSGTVLYCRSVVTPPGDDRRLCPIIFLPNLNEAISKDALDVEDFRVMLSIPRTPNLGVVVYHLQKCLDLFLQSYAAHSNFMKKYNSLSELSYEEMKEFLPDLNDKLSGQIRKHKAKQCLLKLLNYKSQEVKLYSYMIENSLYLVWIHLEHYLVNCTTVDSGMVLGKSWGNQLDSRSSKNEFEISNENLTHLKTEVLSCINETVFRKLQEIVQIHSHHNARSSFMEALVRRLKRIIRLNTK